MNIYKLNNELGVQEGFIETAASEEIVQVNWNKVRSDVYTFEQRRYIESVNAGVTGTKSIEELMKLLEFLGYSSEKLDTGEPIAVIDAVIVEFA